MSSRKEYPVELREWAVRMFTEIGEQHESERADHNADRQIYRGHQVAATAGPAIGCRVDLRRAPELGVKIASSTYIATGAFTDVS